MIAAFKTPTLRGLVRSRPYLHDSSAREIDHAIKRHFEGPINPYLDPLLLLDPNDPGKGRKPVPPEQDLGALVGFLRALSSADLPEVLANPQKFPPPVPKGP